MAAAIEADAQSVVRFWREAGHRRWFGKDAAFDAEIRARFEALHLQAARGALGGWAAAPQSTLALVLLLDQVPRNIYRGTAHAFATDPLAHAVVDAAVQQGQDRDVPLDLQPFFYLPFEHREDLDAQRRAVTLMDAYVARGGHESYGRYARLHAEIIARFGRFPHRNTALARPSTPEELAYLADGGFKG